jgi:hypothetical protein
VRKSPQDGKALALRLLEASTRGEKAVVLDKLVEKLLSAQRQRSPSGLDQALACLALLDYRSGPAHAGAAAGLRRLVTLQREDGGWAAKADSQSDPLATALALLALARGKQMGLESASPALKKAHAYLRSNRGVEGGETRMAAIAFGRMVLGDDPKTDPVLRQIVRRMKRTPLKSVDPMAALLRTAVLERAGFARWKFAAAAASEIGREGWTFAEAQALAQLARNLAETEKGPFSIRD